MDSFLSMMALVATIVELIISVIGLIYELGKKGEKKREAPAETWNLDRRPINLHERHIMRRSLIGDAFQDAGKMKDVGLIQVFGSIVFCFLALALVVANALCLAFLDEDRASITEIILIVPALICLLFSAYFLICLLFKVIRFRDIPQRLIGMLFTLCSKKKGVHLALSNIEGLVGNYANCLVIHADEKGLGDSFSLFASKPYSSDDLQPLSFDDEADTVFLVYSMYGESSCVAADRLSEVHANVYDLGGVAYNFSYYDRQARVIAYLKEANLLKKYEPCSPVV